jgi:hypothetical protein
VGVGSPPIDAFYAMDVRVAFAPQGMLFAGFTDRGWGGQPPADGVGRIRPTGRAPLEILNVHLIDAGFELEFTQPLRSAPQPADVQLFQYDYDYWWEYGSPARHQTQLAVGGVALSADKRTATLRIPGLKAGMCVRARLNGLVSQSGEPLLHEEFAYTINQLQSGPPNTELVAKLVPPPPAKESSAEGMLELSWGDALDSWEQSGWRAVASEIGLDANDRHQFVFGEARDPRRDAVLINDRAEGGTPSELVSRYEFSDVDVHLDFMLPEGGNSGLYLMGRYEVQLLDSSGRTNLRPGDCGGIYQGDPKLWPGRAPLFNAFRGPGQWHGLTVRFRAPRFDAQGKKTSNARFERVMIDDVLLQENVDVPAPTGGAFADPLEVASGPLRLQGDHGPVAFRNIWVRPVLDSQTVGQSIFDGQSLAGWRPAAGWSASEGVLRAEDGAARLGLERTDLSDVRLTFEARVPSKTAAAVYLRGDGVAQPGYGLSLAVFSELGEQAGSLLGRRAVRGQLAPPNLWFKVEFELREEPKGLRDRQPGERAGPRHVRRAGRGAPRGASRARAAAARERDAVGRARARVRRGVGHSRRGEARGPHRGRRAGRRGRCGRIPGVRNRVPGHRLDRGRVVFPMRACVPSPPISPSSGSATRSSRCRSR